MDSSPVPSGELVTEVVQVIRGGEPDDDGLPLAGLRSPFAPTLNRNACACHCAPLPYPLWESVERHDPYAPGSRVWLRVLPPGCEPPLPEGAVLVTTHTVSYAVS